MTVKKHEENLNSFACFILCHGRPEKTPTYDTLRKYGYKGKIYIICDDEDATVPKYKEVFGSDVVKVFSKDEALKKFDRMTNENKRGCAVYARNACFDIARELGLQYFCELDDDYVEFQWRYESEDKLKLVYPIELDEVFLEAINFMNINENIYSVAFAQGGDFIGGLNGSGYKNKLRRKCMNSWICDVDKEFTFNGVMNDDVNAYTLHGSRGKVFFTINHLMVNQPDTQQIKGGMTDMYSGDGTYMKSWYTILQCPSFTSINMMGDNHYRIHHNINWENAVPKIISGDFKK